jgi:general secretion pathway protein A
MGFAMSSYLDFYDLKEPPFEGQPGRGPVLATRPLRDALAWVGERIDADDSILCVSGVPGVGRTSVARVLPGTLTPECRIARIQDPARQWAELRVALADQLSLDGALGKDTLLAARMQGYRLVVVVDAAELSDAVFLEHLDEILDLRGPARERLVQAVLFAQVPRGDLKSPVWKWLQERPARTRELEPISLDEIHRYIRKRLEHAARATGPVFTETAAMVVHRHTRGIPRKVNEACDAVLEAAVRCAARQVDGRLVADALMSWA